MATTYDEFDMEAIQDWLLNELTLLRGYRQWVQAHEEGGSLRMRLNEHRVMRDHVLDQLRRVRGDH